MVNWVDIGTYVADRQGRVTAEVLQRASACKSYKEYSPNWILKEKSHQGDSAE
jgi:hypothetical protein